MEATWHVMTAYSRIHVLLEHTAHGPHYRHFVMLRVKVYVVGYFGNIGQTAVVSYIALKVLVSNNYILCFKNVRQSSI